MACFLSIEGAEPMARPPVPCRKFHWSTHCTVVERCATRVPKCAAGAALNETAASEAESSIISRIPTISSLDDAFDGRFDSLRKASTNNEACGAVATHKKLPSSRHCRYLSRVLCRRAAPPRRLLQPLGRRARHRCRSAAPPRSWPHPRPPLRHHPNANPRQLCAARSLSVSLMHP